MKKIKSHFRFNKQEQSGIFFLLFIIMLLQISFFVLQSFSVEKQEFSFFEDKKLQAEVNLLKQRALQKDTLKRYPFNPNFITDYKGYQLGMSTEEIDRLHRFRSTGKYLNSSTEFQHITLVSDSLLENIAPYFKFPEWVSRTKNNVVATQQSTKKATINSEVTVIKDLNSVSAKELQVISGIGEKLSARIVKFRDQLGGFLVDDQLYDVYGLAPDVVRRTLTKFKVIKKPKIEKIDLTWASYNDLRNVLYISHNFAKSIIEYRKNKTILSFSELKELDGFPEGKLSRLQLYLSL